MRANWCVCPLRQKEFLRKEKYIFVCACACITWKMPWAEQRVFVTDKTSGRKRKIQVFIFERESKRIKKDVQSLCGAHLLLLVDMLLVAIISSTQLSAMSPTVFGLKCPWTSLFFFFLPSLLYSRIHEFPIFVIAYLQGQAMAACVQKKGERVRKARGSIRDEVVWLTDEYCNSNGPCFIDYTERTIL